MFFFSKNLLLDVSLGTKYPTGIEKLFKVLTFLNLLKVNKANKFKFSSLNLSGCYIIKLASQLF